MTPTRLDTDRLTQLVCDKLDVLQRMRQLAQRQSQAIADGETESLLQLLSAKQVLLNRLKQVQHELMPFHKQDPETRRWPTTEARNRCRQLVAACDTVLRETMEIEQQCEIVLSQRRDEARLQLQASDAAADAARAYLQADLPGSSLLDLSSES